MRQVASADITSAVKEAVKKANFILPGDVKQALVDAVGREESEIGRHVLGQLIENAEIAAQQELPICQDCGLAVILADVGQAVEIAGAGFEAALTEGVRLGYEEGYLRKSVCHPFSRDNTGDNTPIVIHTRLVEGDTLKLYIMPKGGGSENMSRVQLLTPSQGLSGIEEAVRTAVIEAGPNPCPPVIVSVAVGGTFDDAAVRAKRNLLRPLGRPHPDPEVAELEERLLKVVNDTGVGPQGLGGRVTALGVVCDVKPCHIASLPVAINIQCHAARHVEVEL